MKSIDIDRRAVGGFKCDGRSKNSSVFRRLGWLWPRATTILRCDFAVTVGEMVLSLWVSDPSAWR